MDLSLEQFAQAALEGVLSRNYLLIAAVAVIALVWAAREFAGKRLPFLRTDRGGAVLVLLTALACAIVTTFAAGVPVTPQLVLHALIVGFNAAGGYAVVRKILKGTPSSGAGGSGASDGEQPAAPASIPERCPTCGVAPGLAHFSTCSPPSALEATLQRASRSQP